MFRDFIISDYLKRLKKLRPELFKNGVLADENARRRLNNCVIRYKNNITTAETILDVNLITIGSKAKNKKLLLFHELEHVRKGYLSQELYPYQYRQLDASWNGDKLNLIKTFEGKKVFESSKGKFFSEAITEFVAQCLLLNLDKSKIGYDFVPVRERYGDKVNLLVGYAHALNLNPLDLCILIEKRMFYNDFEIDGLGKEKELYFDIIEYHLDPSATVVMVETSCKNKNLSKEENGKIVYATGCDEETKKFAEEQVRKVEEAFKYVIEINEGKETSKHEDEAGMEKV